jgi:hypothetical protein
MSFIKNYWANNNDEASKDQQMNIASLLDFMKCSPKQRSNLEFYFNLIFHSLCHLDLRKILILTWCLVWLIISWILCVKRIPKIKILHIMNSFSKWLMNVVYSSNWKIFFSFKNNKQNLQVIQQQKSKNPNDFIKIKIRKLNKTDNSHNDNDNDEKNLILTAPKYKINLYFDSNLNEKNSKNEFFKPL